MSGEKCGFVWRDFHDDEHVCGRPPGEHDPHLCESCPVMEFVDAGPETDDGEPVRVPWRFDVPEVPASVTAIKIGRGDRWGRIDANRWGRLWEDPSSGKWCITDARMSTAQLFGCGQSLVECEDPRAAS